MIKRLLAAVFALVAAAAFAAVDVNKATQAELESIKGIGPAISTRILDERKKASFKDWADLVERVKGVGEANAARFSSEGLTVNGQVFKGAAPAAKAPAKSDKAPKVEAKAAAAAPKAEEKPAKAAATKADDKTAAAPKAEEKAAARSAKAEKKAAGTEVAASAAAAKK